jgi:L-ascorbate metabolism protein UlaG (beta-lactamase superfamily)
MMRVTWVGHACLLVETPQGNLITDPWLVDPCLYEIVVHAQQPSLNVNALPKIDVICITHTHYDHFDPRTLQHLPKTALVIIPPSPARRLAEKLYHLGFTRVQTLPNWKSITAHGMTVTAIPSSGIPEECGFVVSDRDSTIFHAADSVYWTHGKRLTRHNIDVAFLPYTGWDLTGVLGIDADRQWQPNWEETAKFAVSTGARYVVPASCDQFWAPPQLQWLNDRIHPGTAEEFFGAIAHYRTQHPDCQTKAVIMTPGSTWSKVEGFKIAPKPKGAIALPDPLPPATSIVLDEILTSGAEFAKRRKKQLLECCTKGIEYVYGMILLLTHRYTFYLWDTRQYVGMHLIKSNSVYPMTQVAPETTVIHLSSQDASDLFAGRIDIEMLVMASRFKVVGKKVDRDMLFIYALEYLFVKDTYPELVSA